MRWRFFWVFLLSLFPCSAWCNVTANEKTQATYEHQNVSIVMLTNYVKSRESYYIPLLADYYDAVRVMSHSDAYKEFVKESDPNNPLSPASKLGGTSYRNVKIKDVHFNSANQATVDFIVVEYAYKSDKNDYVKQSELPRKAVVDFQFIKMALTDEERIVNPLGFRVLKYEVTQPNIIKADPKLE